MTVSPHPHSRPRPGPGNRVTGPLGWVWCPVSFNGAGETIEGFRTREQLIHFRFGICRKVAVFANQTEAAQDPGIMSNPKHIFTQLVYSYCYHYFIIHLQLTNLRIALLPPSVLVPSAHSEVKPPVEKVLLRGMGFPLLVLPSFLSLLLSLVTPLVPHTHAPLTSCSFSLDIISIVTSVITIPLKLPY